MHLLKKFVLKNKILFLLFLIWNSFFICAVRRKQPMDAHGLSWSLSWALRLASCTFRPRPGLVWCRRLFAASPTRCHTRICRLDRRLSWRTRTLWARPARCFPLLSLSNRGRRVSNILWNSLDRTLSHSISTPSFYLLRIRQGLAESKGQHCSSRRLHPDRTRSHCTCTIRGGQLCILQLNL